MEETAICSNPACSFGGIPQPLSRFRVSGKKRRGRCKSCETEYQRQYRKTDKGKAVYTDYNHSDIAKARCLAYDRSDAGKQQKNKYRASRAEEYSAYYRAYNRSESGKRTVARYAASAKGQAVMRGQLAVRYAIKRGEISPIETQRCADCGEQATSYHHYLGYSDEQLLDVVPVCHKCHKARHLTFCSPSPMT